MRKEGREETGIGGIERSRERVKEALFIEMSRRDWFVNEASRERGRSGGSMDIVREIERCRMGERVERDSARGRSGMVDTESEWAILGKPFFLSE